MRKFFQDLKRRGVWTVGIGYLAASWLLIQVLETVLPIFELPETSIRWLVITLALGFLPALALAWLFEWTPKGVRRDSEVEHESDEAGVGTGIFSRAVILILVLAVTYFAVDKFIVGGQETTHSADGERTIAVLPFADLTAAGDQAWFADGIAEEILNLLVQVPSIRVASRTSSFTFRDSDVPIEEIGRRLHVGHIIEGSVRRVGDKVRVTAQLISAVTGFHIWSATYERRIDDVFAIQDEIAAQIVGALHGDSAPVVPETAVTDADAYALFLKARYRSRRGSEEGLRDAAKLYRESLAIDPGYAAAWSELSSTYINLASSGFIDYHQGYQQAREAALRSIETDPRHTSGYYELAWIAFWYEADIAAALRYTERARELAARGPVPFDVPALLLQAIGRQQDALVLHEITAARSPVDPLANFNLALAYKYADRLDDAKKAFEKVLRLSPKYASARYHLGETQLLQGNPREALETWTLETDEAFHLKGLSLAQFSLGNQQAADQALAKLIIDWGEQWPSEVAHVYAWRGELDAAFEWLEKEYETYGAGGWGEWKLQRLYDNLRDDPRWQAFLQRAGVADEQLASLVLNFDNILR